MGSNIRFSLIFVLSLILVMSTSEGRKDLEKYWEERMKGQAMPEAIKGLVEEAGPLEIVEERTFVKDFETRPKVTAYNDDEVKSTRGDCNEMQKDRPKTKKTYMDDFEPRPNVSIYND